MFCYYEKQMLSVLGLVLYELDANKKCQVSLVVKYMNWHLAVHRKLMPISLDISQNLVIQGQTLLGLQKRSKKFSSGAFISIMEFEDVIDSRKH